MRHAEDKEPSGDTRLFRQLRNRAAWLSYPAFAVCVQRVLSHQGYEEIRLLAKAGARSRTPREGADMDGVAPSPLGRTATLIQLKRHARSVPRRFVDELRGKMLLYEVPHGVMVTTSTFSNRASSRAMGYPGRPVRLIDGDELGRLMAEAGIGVAEDFDPRTGLRRLSVNEVAFMNLESFCARLAGAEPPYPLTAL